MIRCLSFPVCPIKIQTTGPWPANPAVPYAQPNFAANHFCFVYAVSGHPHAIIGETNVQPRTFYRGDPAPWFVARTTAQERYRFDTAAGRYVVLCFHGSAGNPIAAAALRVALVNHWAAFDDGNACLFAVSTDPDDERLGRLSEAPGVRPVWDFDREVSRLYGATVGGSPGPHNGFWLVLDPNLRVLRHAPLEQAEAVMSYLATLPPPASRSGPASRAPVLVMPGVLEPGFCQHLIGLYRGQGGEPSGFMLD